MSDDSDDMNGNGLPDSLRKFMLEHYAQADEPIRLSSDNRLTSSDNSKSEIVAVLEVMLKAGYPHEQIKDILSVLVKKSSDTSDTSSDNRLTIVPDPVARKRARDVEYQRKHRLKVKKVSDVSDDAGAEYISSSLPSLEVDTNKESKSSGIRAREWFEKLWRVYPKRQGGNPRKPAEDQFNIALKNGHDPERIIAGAEAYALSCKRSNTIGTAYVAHARTWLRQQRWNDDYSDHGGSNARPGSGLPNTPGAPRKENGAQRAYRLKQEALARQSGGGLSNSAEGVVELDPSEWTSGNQTRANGNGTPD